MPKLCLCHSGLPYSQCCQSFHKGSLPLTALQLMRSRYSAYARHLADYIISTTHPDSPYVQVDLKQWRKDVLEFCENTQFIDLKIISFQDGEKTAQVEFIAFLRQQGQDVQLRENSFFKKVDGKWLYVQAVQLIP